MYPRALRRRSGPDRPSDHAGYRQCRRSARDGTRRERHLPELLDLHAGAGRTCKCSQRDRGRAGILWSRAVLHGQLESGLLRCLRSTTRSPHTAPATARLTGGVLHTPSRGRRAAREPRGSTKSPPCLGGSLRGRSVRESPFDGSPSRAGGCGRRWPAPSTWRRWRPPRATTRRDDGEHALLALARHHPHGSCPPRVPRPALSLVAQARPAPPRSWIPTPRAEGPARRALADQPGEGALSRTPHRATERPVRRRAPPPASNRHKRAAGYRVQHDRRAVSGTPSSGRTGTAPPRSS